MKVERSDVLGLRVRAQQLDRDGGGTVADTAVLDVGAQDTGPDGALWALAVRGLTQVDEKELVWLWTLRGAPHAYRRADVGSVAAAVAPWSDADAAKRIFDASKPLKAAGIGTLEALDQVAAAMRRIVTRPTVKGEVSTRLTAVLPEPYLRWCNPCQATHLYEQPFRLAAVRAGLELQPNTSPPVLQRVRGFRAARHPAGPARARAGVPPALRALDPQLAAGFLDAPVTDVRARWPEDVVEVDLDGRRRWLLADDVDALGAPPATTRLLGPYDLYLQGKDRPLLVDDPARAKVLWPVIGRPGAVLVDGEVVGTWRPRTTGRRLRLEVVLWDARRRTRTQVTDQAERLAAHRGVGLAGVDVG